MIDTMAMRVSYKTRGLEEKHWINLDDDLAYEMRYSE